MLNVPEYITSVYQPFSAFDSVSSSSGNLDKDKIAVIAVIKENFSGGRGKPWNPQCRDKNNIPYEQSVNGVVKYTGSVVKDTDTGFYYNIQPDFNRNAVLSLSQKMADHIFQNPYKKN
jgi:hypothetical protein